MSSSPSARANQPGSATFLSDAETGALRSADGGRVAALPAEFVRMLHFMLVEQTAENAADVLYRSGYEWALREMVALAARLRAANPPADLWRAEPKAILDAWWTGFAAGGWGEASFDVSAVARGRVFVDLRSSAVVATLGSVDEPVCHLYAGLFAGAVSFFQRIERHAAEVQCAGMGATPCMFIIGPGPDIDAVEGWRQQSVAPLEIRRRLHG